MAAAAVAAVHPPMDSHPALAAAAAMGSSESPCGTDMAIAICNSVGQVVTFVRDDVAEGWSPPDGCTAVPEAELPAGWTRAPEPVPPSVSARQIRLWLIQHGVSMSAVDAAIDAIADPAQRDAVRVEWEYAPYVERSHPMLVPLAEALGLSADGVDQAFREAATL